MPAADQFARDGYLAPFRVFTDAECRRIAEYLGRSTTPAPASWGKARAVHERFIYELATWPALLTRVAELLGDDVVLWGASAVRRVPGQVHPWHSDIESCSPEGGFVSAWIGVEHTTRESALQVIARSHLLGQSVQEARMRAGIAREQATPEAMLELARQREPEATLDFPDMHNGEALLFDGRIWHGSDNRSRAGNRVALLLQYAAAGRPVRIPDFSQLDWPFRFRQEPRPPVIVVRGSDVTAVNRVVPPPPPESAGASMVETVVHSFDLPVGDAEPAKPWQAFHAFGGATRTCADITCHASVLAGGHIPHPPHSHVEEELLIPLHGEVELTIPSGPADAAPRRERLRPGALVYYPAWQYHTIRNPGTTPVGYLMFKWRAPLTEATEPLGVGITRFEDLAPPSDAPPFWTQRLFEGPTGCLGKLHCHLTVLQPGAGYEPHRDAYDVAIVMLAGTVETLGQTVGPQSVIYYGAGELHGMRNVGDEPARYLVFEFHAPGVDALQPSPPLYRAWSSSLVRAGKRVARPVWRKVKPYLAKVS
jgi:mannose-6-phosphate isomerase-like protein (cupin superfamily)